MNLRRILFILVCLISFSVAVFLIVCVVRNVQTAKSDDQQLFIEGRVPQPLPNGFYAGSASVTAGWKGKEFDAAVGKGINIFSSRGADRRQYPFMLSTGKGVKDTEVDVVKIDYDIDANPFWLKPVLDEVVELEDGVLLGKLQYRLIPNHPFTIIFFRLTPP